MGVRSSTKGYRKTLSRSGCLNFDFDALRSLPQGCSRVLWIEVYAIMISVEGE